MRRISLIIGSLAVLCVLAGCATAEPTPLATTPAGSNDTIVPAITTAGVDPNLPGYLTATGSVAGLSESGGRCDFTFWAENGEATRLSGTGRAADGHTECGPVNQPLGFLPRVNYEAELRYVSVSGETFVSERVPMTLPRPTPATP